MNGIGHNSASEAIGKMNPLNKSEVQEKFPDCIVQRGPSMGHDTFILTISDGTNSRKYLEISNDQYLPFTLDGEDISDIISSVWANKSVEFMNAHSIAYNPRTAALKQIDGKLVGPCITEPYVNVYTKDGDYLERMILKEWKLSRAKLHGKEVMLHDASRGGGLNKIQFIGSENILDFSGELELDNQDNIVLINGKLLSKKNGLTQEWEVKSDQILLIGTKCVGTEGQVLPITLLGKDVSSKIETNEYGDAPSLRFSQNGKKVEVIINNKTGAILTYKDCIITAATGITGKGDITIGICCNLQGEEEGVVLFHNQTFEVRTITLNGKNVSKELTHNWGSIRTISYKGQEYNLNYESGVLYDAATQVVDISGKPNDISFLGGKLPTGAIVMQQKGMIQLDPNDSHSLVRYNIQTGEVDYKKDSHGKIFLEYISRFGSDRIEAIVFYNPKTRVSIKISDSDLCEEIQKLPYATTQSVIQASVTAVEEVLPPTNTH